MNRALFLILLFSFVPGCKADKPTAVALYKCVDCHPVHTDTNHQQACISCHKGNNKAKDKDEAHTGYVPLPAHPDAMAETCGPCHPEITDRVSGSIHFTLGKSTNLFRKSFGAEKELHSFRETPKKSVPETALELADDLLRRRCFRCHPYNSGDPYPAVKHGTGCAACHIAFADGKPEPHFLQSPGDAQCMSCHYGNYVGFDYYGRFEHDFNAEYRTPFTTTQKYFRPYGVEYHQLKADVHQSRGLLCIDCHSGRELMGAGEKKPSCKSCHQLEELQRSLPARVEDRLGLFLLRGHDGKDHPLPLMQHPAHQKYSATVSCQACHAQWTFNDFGKHFLRSDNDDFDMLANLATQGSFEIETIVRNNNDFDKTELPGQMTDKLTGEPEPGLWYKGFSMRRWETVLLGRDDSGRITTMRPMLDFYLSWIDADDRVLFDSVGSQVANGGVRPYVPHTTGPAGFFYRERLERFLVEERAAAQK